MLMIVTALAVLFVIAAVVAGVYYSRYQNECKYSAHVESGFAEFTDDVKQLKESYEELYEEYEALTDNISLIFPNPQANSIAEQMGMSEEFSSKIKTQLVEYMHSDRTAPVRPLIEKFWGDEELNMNEKVWAVSLILQFLMLSHIPVTELALLKFSIDKVMDPNVKLEELESLEKMKKGLRDSKGGPVELDGTKIYTVDLSGKSEEEASKAIAATIKEALADKGDAVESDSEASKEEKEADSMVD